jgi:hypothetical protein
MGSLPDHANARSNKKQGHEGFLSSFIYQVLPTTMMQNQPLQQDDPGGFYSALTISARHYCQTQLGDHNLYGDGSYLTRGFQPQSPGQQGPNRCAVLSFTYQDPRQPIYGWQNSMVSSGHMSSTHAWHSTWAFDP